MIITRTPFRISFFGGGTDFPDFCQKNGGAVLSATINKYCYITCRWLPPFFKCKHRIRYTKKEETESIDEIKHPVVRESLKWLNIDKGIETVHTSDIPAMSGIGSSSSFTVGFLQGLHALNGQMTTKRQLAVEAINIEQNILKENVGSQDQIAAAFGGFNRIEFSGLKNFYVSPITIKSHKLALLQDNLMLFYTGISRYSSVIAEEHIKNIAIKNKELLYMKDLVVDAVDILNSPTEPIESFGKLLGETWKIKRSLSKSVTNDEIDNIYSTALTNGALGGKLLGAGGGGFFLFFVPPEKQTHVEQSLKGCLHVPFQFEDLGSQVIMYAKQEAY